MAPPTRPDLFTPHAPTPSDRRDTSGGYASSQSGALEQSLRATRLLGADERPGRNPRDGGHSFFGGHHELFADSAPALALQQEFQRLKPDYIALHGIGAAWCRKLLQGIAAATRQPVTQLDIRQQGSGSILASVDHVDCPSTDGGTVRIYSTELPAEHSISDVTRRQIALVLLANARLGVVMVGDVSPAAMREGFLPLRQGMATGPWPSRNLLLLPLTSAGALATVGNGFFDDTGVTVRTTPQVRRSSEAWSFVSGTWNRLREELKQRASGFGGQPIMLPALPGARTVTKLADPASDSRPPPPTTKPAHLPPTAFDADTTALNRLVSEISALSGLLACRVFSVTGEPDTALSVQTAIPAFKTNDASGTHASILRASNEALTAQGRAWFQTAHEGASKLGVDPAGLSLAFTFGECHILIRPILSIADKMVMCLFARTDKPMLYEMQLQRVENDWLTQHKQRTS